MAAGEAMTPECGHPDTVKGCGPCEAGLARLVHCIEEHGMYAAPCPRCGGFGCAVCGDGEVYAFPVKPGECADGAGCVLGVLGRERGSA